MVSNMDIYTAKTYVQLYPKTRVIEKCSCAIKEIDNFYEELYKKLVHSDIESLRTPETFVCAALVIQKELDLDSRDFYYITSAQILEDLIEVRNE